MTALRIANGSGFLGDRRHAPLQMVEGGPIDVLTGDYLAELTMAILLRKRMADPAAGYADAFVDQLEEILGACIERGIRVVANAGGLNPAGLASALRELATRLGVDASIAAVTGDDVTEVLREGSGDAHPLLTAHAYLGGWGIAAALDRGADVVVTGRVADASLAVGAAAWHHGWQRDDWDSLAGAVVAGHAIECGAQVSGGNYSFFAEVPDLREPGFPIAEIAADGTSVITKHPGTGGLVSIGTVTEQLLYEIGPPAYLNPDVTAHLDTVRLALVGDDRVAVSGARGSPPPETTKVSATFAAGHRNQVTFLLTGLDIPAKADVALEALWHRCGGSDRFDEVDVQLLRTDRPNAPTNEQAVAYLQVTVVGADPTVVGRAFSSAAVETALSSYPGLSLTAPPGRGRPQLAYRPLTIAQPPSIVAMGDARFEVPPASPGPASPRPPITEPARGGTLVGDEPTVDAPLGRVVGARSGDKGGDANVGLWARTDEVYRWLAAFMTEERMAGLFPDLAPFRIERHLLANLRACNYVIHGLLGDGVATSTRWDPQAKGLGEYVRSRTVPIPERFLAV